MKLPALTLITSVSVATAFLASVVVCGCGSHEVTSEDVRPKDEMAGISPEQKIQALREDPKLNSMEKSQRISDAQKAAGLPVTGQ